MLIRVRAVGWLTVAVALSLAACRGPVLHLTASPSVTYAPARQGLPTSKIWKSQLSFGDINGDGFSDIGAISRLADGPWIWMTDGKGNWTEAANGLPRETFCGGGVKFADMNNDKLMDVAIADHCKGVYAFFGDGAGNWKFASSGLPTVGSEDIAVGDFNNDGCVDVAIVAAQEEGIRAYKGNCKGTWQESSDGLPLSEWGNGITMGDMNNDGNLDIIAAYSMGPRVFLGDGKGNWREASEGLPAPEIHGLYWGIAVGDVNGDGRLDIASGSAIPGTEVFIQGDGGKFRNISSAQCGGGSNNGNFCMSDGDCPGGACATSICWGTCSAGENSGKPCDTDGSCGTGGKCAKGDNYGAPCSGPEGCPAGSCAPVNNPHGIIPMNALGVAFGDLDKDGKMDLVAVGKSALDEIGGVYGVFPFKGDGKGNFTYLEGTGLPSTGRERTWGVTLGDANGDGVLDIGVAFGDVLSPTWRSGKKTEGEKEKPKDPKEAAADAAKMKGPERGRYGSIEVWQGTLTGK